MTKVDLFSIILAGVMLIYAGIDEAGYGPLLGPLCVAATTFVLPDHDPADGAPDLWEILHDSVCRADDNRKGRIAIDDSKKLKGAKSTKRHPLKRLERGVLSFMSPQGLPGTDVELFKMLRVITPDEWWYESETKLPVGQTNDELNISASRLSRVLKNRDIQLSAIECEMIDVHGFNDQFQKMGTKSAINFCAIMRLVDRIWKKHASDHPRIIVDRQGGRTHYREVLQMSYPDAKITVVTERTDRSRYRLKSGSSELTISFVKESEREHLPVALASMTAKYVRELMMIRLNRFFSKHMPELKPTAGYVQDGRRFMKEVGPVVKKLQINQRQLVRQV